MYISRVNATSNLSWPYLVRIHILYSSKPHVYASPEFSTLPLTHDERTWLENNCPYFKPVYLDYLYAYRFKPSQVQVSFVPRASDSSEGRIEIDVSGPWVEAILWEVPLMATLSEIYFTTADNDWSDDDQAGAFA
jgi:nicotinate phosphoribosyltransferase